MISSGKNKCKQVARVGSSQWAVGSSETADSAAHCQLPTANYNPLMRSNLLARIGMRSADFCERWFPDAFVFALAAIVLVFIGGLSIVVAPVKLATEFGHGFW